MEMKDYMADYVNTVVTMFESKHFDEESMERATHKLPDILRIKNQLVEICKELDDAKRFIFYRKGDCPSNVNPVDGLDLQKFRILHAAVGMATESVEFLEEAVDGIVNNNLDVVHLIEEIGDCSWYSAVFCDAVNKSFKDITDANVAKLNIRYAQKFSQDKALSRDLVAERAALEGKVPIIPYEEEVIDEHTGDCCSEDLTLEEFYGNTFFENQDLDYKNTYEYRGVITNVIQFPTSEELWEDNTTTQVIKVTGVLFLVTLAAISAVFGPAILLNNLF